MNRWVSIALVLLAVPMLADENPPQHAHRGAALHYLITTDHVLAPGELAAEGVEVQHALPGNRYLVRATDAAALDEARGGPKAELYAAREKLSSEGLRAGASARGGKVGGGGPPGGGEPQPVRPRQRPLPRRRHVRRRTCGRRRGGRH